MCNECKLVALTVAVGQLRRTLDEMELTLDLAVARCSHCGAVHMRTGMSEILAFVCLQCSRAVNVGKDRAESA